jgi:hypothetical protein
MKSYISKREEITKPYGYFAILPNPVEQGFSAVFYPIVMHAPESIILGFEWDFGDGEKSQRLITRHAYEKAGTYEVQLNAFDNFGNQYSSKQLIRVIKKL